MARGQVAYTEAENVHALFGIGITEDDVLGLEANVTSIATNVLGRLVVFAEGSIQPGAGLNAYDTTVPVFGIEPGDAILSATAVRVSTVNAPNAAGVLADTSTSTVEFSDLTDSAEVSDDDEVTFENVQFEGETGLILVYADLTKPDVNE